MHSFSIDYLTKKDGNSEDSSNDRPYDSSPTSNGSGSSSSFADAQTVSPNYLTMKKTAKGGLEKPQYSYIALISMAILNTKDKKALLGDIYKFIMDKFPYFNNKDKAWRNSIRHNLSLNECFIKSGRAENGKSNFWSIHPACIEDFSKGDFRRRQARRRARKSEISDVNVSGMPMSYRCNLGYVQMTSSAIPCNAIPTSHCNMSQYSPGLTSGYLGSQMAPSPIVYPCQPLHYSSSSHQEHLSW